MHDLETTLQRAILNLRSGGLEREEDVKIAVILPILNALDWHSADPESLRPEYQAGPGRVDYALLCHGRPQVFVEAKRRGAVDAKAEAQLFRYAANNGVPLLVLSDGLCWDFYLSMADGRPEERRFDRLELRNEDSVPQYVRTLESCLRKLKVASGEARRDAESRLEDDRSRKRARDAMPDAWNALLNGPDELLCDLLADKVQVRTGAKPRPADVEEFLLRLQVARPSSTPEGRPTRQSRSAITEEPREKTAGAEELQFGNGGGHQQTKTAAMSSAPAAEIIERGESLQDIVRDLMRTVLEDFPGTLRKEEIGQLENTTNPLGLKIGNRKLIRKVSEGPKINGQNRYWVQPFAGRWYVCSEWSLGDHCHNAGKLSQWVRSLITDAEDFRAKERLQDILNRLSVHEE